MQRRPPSPADCSTILNLDRAQDIAPALDGDPIDRPADGPRLTQSRGNRNRVQARLGGVT